MIEKIKTLIDQRIGRSNSTIIPISELKHLAGEDWSPLAEEAALRSNTSVSEHAQLPEQLIISRD